VPPPLEQAIAVQFRVNGSDVDVSVASRRLLSEVLREELGLTGTHVACEHGVCGSCTVLLDGQAVRSCLLFAVQVGGMNVTTIEGLGTPEAMSVLQEAMRDAHAFQCGFCTPGFLISLHALLLADPSPSEAKIREQLSGNLCRCTGYQSIVEGALLAIDRMAHASKPSSSASPIGTPA
jgi:carbon-monoxide dehydrogenase small subunit